MQASCHGAVWIFRFDREMRETPGVERVALEAAIPTCQESMQFRPEVSRIVSDRVTARCSSADKRDGIRAGCVTFCFARGEPSALPSHCFRTQ
jgi:hypothetical protein